MPKLEDQSTVTPHRTQGKTYFRTAVPKDIALNVLGLNTDGRKQKLAWRMHKGKVVVENKKRPR